MLFVLMLSACGGSGSSSGGGGGGGGGGIIPAGVTSFEIIDPSPAAGDRFGEIVAVLANGNVVVSDSFDSSVVTDGGAVHLYDPLAQTLIASFYGDDAGDNIGSADILPPPNGNYVVVSPLDDVGGVSDAGSVRLMDGATGLQIGVAIAGDQASDQIGNGFVEQLENGNFVVVSPFDNVGAVALAGSVRIYDGASGAPIGAGIAGDNAGDAVGAGSIIPLGNGNIVVATPLDNVGGITFAGSVYLLDGVTGNPIGGVIVAGDAMGDSIGLGGIVDLANDNFAILSPGDDIGVIVDAGSVRLFDGTTGAAIGTPITGDTTGDQLGVGLGEPLANGNFVFGSLLDDEAAIVDAGSVRLVDGTTGAQLGPTYAGTSTNEQAGFVTVLGNSNYVIVSFGADVMGQADTGSVLLMDGSTGLQIGTAIDGDVAGDQLGFGSVIALPNNNYVIVSVNDDEGGVVDAGSMRLVDGTTGAPIASLAGDTTGDQLGLGRLAILENGNFALGSFVDNEGGIADAGSVRLIDGVSGLQIGPTLAGDTASDQLGNYDVLGMASGNYVVVSSLDDEGGVIDAGSVRHIDGTSGLPIGTALIGSASGDVEDAFIAEASNGDYFVVGLGRADRGGLIDSGQVFLNAD